MSKAFDEIYCHSCSKAIKKDAEICVACGVKNKHAQKPYNRTTIFLLCLLLGFLGAHRFYVGKTRTGLLYLFTGGFLLVGALIEIINISKNTFQKGI
ncbi:TM2 domain protein (plasmid) [Borreliella finlandensis]|uniref:TM2 domain protein n=1 Tax=Borreliella finlandensis TaxID=498741 RepID=A0A806C7Y4_9SPIR|nr:TM2 domain-containing protein [Borreliella finlandensis]ACN93419.1 TM2 domain protein [Borreliella finlandensis]